MLLFLLLLLLFDSDTATMMITIRDTAMSDLYIYT